MNKRLALLILLLVLFVGVAIVGYINLKDNQPGTSTPAAGPTTTQPSEQAQSETAKPSAGANQPPNNSKTYQVKVYFSRKPESYDDPSKVFAVSRTAPDLGVGKFTISQLIKGPTAQELTQGYFTQVRLRDDASNCGGGDFTLSVSSGAATLQFCRTFDHIGVISDGQAESEIKATLLQFNGVNKVVILNKSGDCEFNLSGLNLCKQ